MTVQGDGHEPSHQNDVPGPRGRWTDTRPAAGYLLILLLIAVSYALCATQSSASPGSLAFIVQLLMVAAVLWVADVARPIRRAGWVVIAIAGVAVVVAEVTGGHGGVLHIILSAASVVAYLVAPTAIIGHQLKRDVVDSETLLASVAAYVLVGMLFTFVYNLVSLLSGVPTFGDADTNSLAAQLFFSFSTLTTTGYGNLVPVQVLLQSTAILEAITGQLFLVIALARVVAAWTRPQR